MNGASPVMLGTICVFPAPEPPPCPDGQSRSDDCTCQTAAIKPNGQPRPGPMGNTQGIIVPDTAPNPHGNSAPDIEATPEEKGWWSRWGSAATHLALDVVGLIPVVGEIADGANALIYLAEGDVANAALSAAAMVPGAGVAATTAKIGKKAAKEATERAAKEAAEKAAKEAAEKAAKEAAEKAAKEAAEKAAAEAAAKGTREAAEGAAGQGAKKAEGKGGGKDLGKRMKEHRVKCFKKNTKGDPAEYDHQLAGQEKGLNDLTVQEYLEGRQRFEEIGRKGTGKAQAEARAAYSKELTDSYKSQLKEQGVTGQAAQEQAARMAAEKMDTLAALHNPDMIAGGKDVVTSMGDKGVNSSIGAQWKDRVADLDKAARDIPASERGSTRMNAKLKRCK